MNNPLRNLFGGNDNTKRVIEPKTNKPISKLGSVEKIKEGEYLITFPYPLEIPNETPYFSISKVKIFVPKNPRMFSFEELKLKNPLKVKMNKDGIPFPAEELLLKMISQTIRGDEMNDLYSNKHQVIGLLDNYWTYSFPKGFTEKKIFDFSNGRNHPTLGSLPLLFCKLEPDYFEEVGICDITKKKELPKDFSWIKYRKIINQFGTIQKYGISNAWYYITFNKYCRNLFNDDDPNNNDIPEEIFLCTQHQNEAVLSGSEFLQNYIRNQEGLNHPTLKIPVKLIDSENLALAITAIIYGNSPRDSRNKNLNFRKLKLPANSFILVSEEGGFDYINFESGRVFFNQRNSTPKETQVLVYRTEPPRYD